MEPIPVGTKVKYHGSLRTYHGVYDVDEQVPMEVLTKRWGPEACEDAYPDGVAYNLWPEGVEKSYRNRDRSLSFVRRQSITPVEAEAT